MAEDRKGLKIKEDGLGEVQIAEEVITIIAGLAATENLSKGVRVEVTEEGKIEVFVTINIAYSYAIPAVSGNVQEKVKAAIENMTGLEVSGVNVRIADVDMKSAVE